jgi:hypothetical protein
MQRFGWSDAERGCYPPFRRLWRGNMRLWPLISLLFLGQCVRSAVPVQLAPVHDALVAVQAIPVALYPDNPARRDLGAFSYLGGWQLLGDVGWFGGLSALHADANHLTAVSDAGAVTEFDVGRFGHVSNAHIMPIPAACGTGGDKADRDSESLAFDPVGGDWWIGVEGRNAVCRVDNAFGVAERYARPPAMVDWPFNYGPETLLRLDDGRVIALAEGARDGGDLRPLLVFAGDPTDPRSAPLRLGYRPPQGFSPTDATQLPDGRVIVVNRRFTPWSLFTVCLTLIDPREFRAGAIVTGREIARFEPPVVTENFEGIAATQEGGQTIIWLVSDSNFASFQRTLLLKFALDPAKLP